jgi:L,D-peptidoglycan transpeptidase YkuD (ErfK/YbiS/YcfS/YnhG family)
MRSARLLVCLSLLATTLVCCKSGSRESDEPTEAPQTAEPSGSVDDQQSSVELPRIGERVEQRVADARHLIVTTTPDWSAPAGELVLYERVRGGWKKVLGPMPANVGRNGMGWGRGLTLPPERASAPIKVEGDGKATAGVFEVGRAHGYAEEPPEGVSIPYEQVTEQTFCVYDTESERYNQVFDWSEGKEKTWDKAETMRREDDQYSLLLTIRHNELNGEPGAIEPGAGSCIFLHVWSGEEQPTIGCTSVEEEELTKVLAELEDLEKTLFVQFPRPVYNELVRRLGLPM